MDSRDIRHRGAEASRLLADPILQTAINTVIEDAKNALVTVDASNMAEVLRLQAGAQAAAMLEDVLNGYILAAQSLAPDPEPTVPNDPGVI